MERNSLITLVDEELSGDRALEAATEMTRYYRSPGASGYHRSTEFIAALFRANGLDKVWTERFPLDGETPVSYTHLRAHET